MLAGRNPFDEPEALSFNTGATACFCSGFALAGSLDPMVTLRPMSEAPLAPRPPRLSHTEMTELVLPQHTNALGTIFGGTVMAWIDICAAIAAQRHCGRIVVTAAVDELIFRAPLRQGDIARISGRVNAAFSSSVEVHVMVEREELGTGRRSLCVDALLTFVALGDDRNPTRVPPLLAETEEERTRERDAHARRNERLAKKKPKEQST